MSKLSEIKKNAQSFSELHEIDRALLPLKELADRERVAIYGLSGMVYTPHIDKYMDACIKKAAITAALKEQGVIPLSEVEKISSALNALHNRVKNNAVVEYCGEQYIRRFLPLKLTKSGKNVQKWAKFWLLQTPEGRIEPNWEKEVKEIWPSYFVIRTIDL